MDRGQPISGKLLGIMPRTPNHLGNFPKEEGVPFKGQHKGFIGINGKENGNYYVGFRGLLKVEVPFWGSP